MMDPFGPLARSLRSGPEMSACRSRRLGNFRSIAARCCRSECGASAVEFALFAPVLFFALVAAADLGLAECERMTIDHALRAGAQSAMSDQGASNVLTVVQSTASKNFTLSAQSAPSTTSLSVSVNRFCACPNATTVAVDCLTTCPGPTPTFIYYRLEGTKVHGTMILPPITLSPTVQVQVR